MDNWNYPLALRLFLIRRSKVFIASFRFMPVRRRKAANSPRPSDNAVVGSGTGCVQSRAACTVGCGKAAGDTESRSGLLKRTANRLIVFYENALQVRYYPQGVGPSVRFVLARPVASRWS